MARRVSSPILVGRRTEIAVLEQALDDARAGQPTVVLVAGEAGAGKSRLLAHVADRVRALHGTVLVGAEVPRAGSAAVPFASLTQVLRNLVRGADAPTLVDLLGSARVELARLLPELGGVPAGDGSADPFGRARLLEAMLAAIERTASGAPVVLVGIEDLHWADESTLLAVAHLSRSLTGRVLLVVTVRGDGPDSDLSLAGLLTELERLPNVERLDLGPLDPSDVRAQLDAILGTAVDAARLDRIVQRADGNPFFVEELALLVDADRDDLPRSVRAGVDARSAGLSPAAAELVRCVAVAGRAVPIELLAAALGDPAADVESASREAMAASLLTPAPGSAGERVDARHVLVREAIVASTTPADRRRLHARIAAALAARPELAGASDLERATRLADHLLAAGEPLAALPALEAAAAAAERARAFPEAARLFELVIQTRAQVSTDADPDALSRLLERAAITADLTGATDLAVRRLTEAGELVERGPGDPDRLARIRIALAWCLADGGRPAEALAVAEAVADRPDVAGPTRVRAQLVQARALQALGRHRASVDVCRSAIAAAKVGGASADAATAHTLLGVALAMGGETHAALDELALARDLEIASPSGGRSRPSRLPGRLRGYLDRAAVLERAGDLDGSARVAAEGAAVASRMGLADYWGTVLGAAAARNLFRQGRWAEADRLMEGTTADSPPDAVLVRALLATNRGDWDTADQLLTILDRSDALALGGPGWAGATDLVRADLAFWRRRPVEARSAARAACAAAQGASDTLALAEAVAVGLRVEAEASVIARSTGATGEIAASEEGAAALLTVLHASVPDGAQDDPARRRPVALQAAGVAEWGRLQGTSDPTAWRDAVAAWDAAGEPAAAAYARWRLAELLLQAGGPRSAAVEPLRAALEVADVLGAQPLVRAIEGLSTRGRLELRAVATAPAADQPAMDPARARARGLGLSEREVDVLELVAEGATDREIGRRLFVTEKTAGHHVSHILTKLGVARRGEAAAIAYRLELAGSRAP